MNVWIVNIVDDSQSIHWILGVYTSKAKADKAQADEMCALFETDCFQSFTAADAQFPGAFDCLPEGSHRPTHRYVGFDVTLLPSERPFVVKATLRDQLARLMEMMAELDRDYKMESKSYILE